MKRFYLLFFIIILFTAVTAQDAELETALYNLPDTRFEKIATPRGYTSAYKLYIRQPVDHNRPEKGYFYQKVFLSTKSSGQPMVMITEGYDQSFNYIFELTRLLDANQVIIEHRYFGESIPEDIDYSFLNSAQAAADLHRINKLLRNIYNGRWVSTGVSKGGQNAIYYRYYYPDDVDVTVPYVAPLNLNLADQRIYTFLDTVGTPECRRKIRDFQVRMLKEQDRILPLIRWYSYGKDLDFNYLSLPQAFEYTILEYSFSFWQWGHNCSEIPPDTVPIEKALKHLIDVSGIEFFSDTTMKKYQSHYYQCASELGYYSYNTDDFRPYLRSLSPTQNPSAIFTPGKMSVRYDPTISSRVYKWATSEADHMIYINGGSDTWSATGVPPSKEPGSLWLIMRGRSHSSARIKNMTAAEKAMLISALEKWLAVDIQEDTILK